MNARAHVDRIQVIIVDDDLFVREALSEYLNAASDIALLDVCDNGADAVESVAKRPPDVVLMDIRLPVLDGIKATAQMVRDNPSIRVLALTSFSEDALVAEMLAAGAVGYLLKSARPLVLLNAIRAAHHGLTVVPYDTVQRWAPRPAARSTVELTEREHQVLDLLAGGLNNRQIGQAMFLSGSTVKGHLRGLMAKLGAANRTTVVARAHELGLLAHRDPS